MNRQEYKAARKLVRENGWSALRWMDAKTSQIMERLKDEWISKDKLAERQSIISYCQREGYAYNFRHLA